MGWEVIVSGDNLEPWLWLFEDWSLVESWRMLGGWVGGIE